MRAKLKKSLIDVESSITYASNNIEAYVLKGLILAETEAYEAALHTIDEALRLNLNNKILRKIRKIIAEKLHPDDHQEHSDEFVATSKPQTE